MKEASTIVSRSRADPPTSYAVCLRVRGEVQGYGVRPAVARLAQQLHLAGSVRNTLAGLELILEGDALCLTEFCRRLPESVPKGCRIERIDEERIAAGGLTAFTIVRDASTGPLATPVPADIAVCSRCLAETSDEQDRRFQYPLTSCAACGPRYSVIRRMPYERDDTSLVSFPFCPDCRAEYESPCDRRFHAQTTACPICGPQVWATDAEGRAVGRGLHALAAAVSCLRQGRILALRGVGGYQLLCDAENDGAVRMLRRRKHRPAKPLAVLVSSLKQAERLAYLSAAERRLLATPANPIVLVSARPASGLASAVHPGLNVVGLMLPTTPLHHEITSSVGRPLICTSGNLEGEPLEYEIDKALRRLSSIADVWLHHDRPIQRPIDDSVVRMIDGRPMTIRLARGLAPLSLELPRIEPMLAVGGHLKVAVAWSNGEQCVLGPHMGDMHTLAARERFTDQCKDCQELYRFVPSRLIYDLHSDYFTTRQAAAGPRPSMGVQHHFAHVAAGMVEHGLLDRTVLGVAWDGTGYGLDGTIWGGEFLLVDRSRSFERVVHLRPFPLIGGEAAIREPWRVAATVLADAIGREPLCKTSIAGADPSRLASLLTLRDRSRLSPLTTSAGRLFDAAAALILSVPEVEFDGQAAMLLESVADRSAPGSYPFPLAAGRPAQLDWRPMFCSLWDETRAAVPPGVMAMRFHRTMAEGVAKVMRRHRGCPVVLTGGVFQNRLLSELVIEQLDDSERLKLPGRIPPNDGGLAAGQLAVAYRMRSHLIPSYSARAGG